MKKVMLIVVVGLFGAGCGADGPGETSEVTRDDADEAKADGFDICWRLGLPEGCDLCDALGWYGDGICDEFCENPDSDCGCGGFAGLVCHDGQYCSYDNALCGGDDAMGECRDLPSTCGASHEPVCGCDGVTYVNVCEASAAGVDVGPAANCPEEERHCGGFAGLVCDDGQYCSYDNALCGGDDSMGECRELPSTCDESHEPVCGCDGVAYDNVCEASAAGVDVAPDDSCEIEERSCGGLAGLVCEEGEYCDFGGDWCGGFDGSGVCKARPDACEEILDPVCGCDGVAYDNECEANAAGYDVGADDSCEIEERSCGGFVGLVCEEYEYCDFDGGWCGGFDGLGLCRARPNVCEEIFEPVCGCDGVVYDNECEANAAGNDVGDSDFC